MTDPKQIAMEWLARLSASDTEGALALMADDVAWRIAGTPELTPVHGDHDKARLRRMFNGMLAQLTDGLHMTLIDTITEGNRVALECESRGDLKNGRKYRQQYHLAITIRDGKIARVHEYLDTHHAFDVWIKP